MYPVYNVLYKRQPSLVQARHMTMSNESLIQTGLNTNTVSLHHGESVFVMALRL